MRFLQPLYHLLFPLSQATGSALEAFAPEISEVSAQKNWGHKAGGCLSFHPCCLPPDLVKEMTSCLLPLFSQLQNKGIEPRFFQLPKSAIPTFIKSHYLGR